MNLYEYLEVFTQEGKAKMALLRDKKLSHDSHKEIDIPVWIITYLQVYKDFVAATPSDAAKYINKWDITQNKLQISQWTNL